MMMLKSKLFALMEEKQAKELKEIQGEQKEIAWGSQIPNARIALPITITAISKHFFKNLFFMTTLLYTRFQICINKII